MKRLQLPEIYMNKSPAPASDATQDSIIQGVRREALRWSAPLLCSRTLAHSISSRLNTLSCSLSFPPRTHWLPPAALPSSTLRSSLWSLLIITHCRSAFPAVFFPPFTSYHFLSFISPQHLVSRISSLPVFKKREDRDESVKRSAGEAQFIIAK